MKERDNEVGARCNIVIGWAGGNGDKIFIGEHYIRTTGLFADEIPFTRVQRIEDQHKGLFKSFHFFIEYTNSHGKFVRMRISSGDKLMLLQALKDHGFTIY